ncbi:hypothetical protein ACYPKM_03025 [Pseudomonas aeruginosa]
MAKVTYNPAVRIDTEDKEKWCLEGYERELAFVKHMNKYSSLSVSINPEKQWNECAPDLLVPGYGKCDLKSQQTPFFRSGKMGIDPNYAFTLNLKDVIRYRSLYPGLGIFFWLEWINNSHERYGSVDYKWGVYFSTIKEVLGIIDAGIAPCHEYENRKEAKGEPNPEREKRGMNADGNAKASYLLNVQWLTPILSSTNNPWS